MVHVFQCKNLKCLFSHSLISQFPMLEDITVEECSEIEHVFYFNEDNRVQEVRHSCHYLFHLDDDFI